MGLRRQTGRKKVETSWDEVADWYVGWVGTQGSKHHRRLAIPSVMELLEVRPKESILDLGAGPGVLAGPIAEQGAVYTGIDASERLIRFARRHHGDKGRFVVGDVRQLERLPFLRAGSFDGAVFMLSLQDIDPIEAALRSAAWALRTGGRLVLLLTHPCFRIPRQSGWGWDEGRKLHYRRVDRYLTPVAVPLRDGATRSFHRPLHMYINGLAECGLLLDCMREITSYKQFHERAEQRAEQEFPVFLALRARKIASG